MLPRVLLTRSSSPAGTEEILSFGVASSARTSSAGSGTGNPSQARLAAILTGPPQRRAITWIRLFPDDPISGLRVGVPRPPQTLTPAPRPRARVGLLCAIRIMCVQRGPQPSFHGQPRHQAGRGFIVYDIVVSSAIIGVAASGHLCLSYPSTSTFSVPTSASRPDSGLTSGLVWSRQHAVISSCLSRASRRSQKRCPTLRRMKLLTHKMREPTVPLPSPNRLGFARSGQIQWQHVPQPGPTRQPRPA